MSERKNKGSMTLGEYLELKKLSEAGDADAQKTIEDSGWKETMDDLGLMMKGTSDLARSAALNPFESKLDILGDTFSAPMTAMLYRSTEELQNEEIIEELRKLNEREENRERNKMSTTPKAPRKKYGPNRGTVGKINKLISNRDKSLREGRGIPQWIAACQGVGIRPETVISNFPELRENWDVPEYRPDSYKPENS